MALPSTPTACWKKRSLARLKSALLDVPGVGPKSSRALLRHFGSLAKVKVATAEELGAVVNQKQAAAIAKHFAGNLT